MAPATFFSSPLSNRGIRLSRSSGAGGESLDTFHVLLRSIGSDSFFGRESPLLGVVSSFHVIP